MQIYLAVRVKLHQEIEDFLAKGEMKTELQNTVEFRMI